MRFLAILAALCFAASAHAQILIVKAGADGKVFEPQPLTLVSAILTTPTITGAVLTTPAIGAATGTSLALGTDPADAGAIRLENAAAIAWEADVAGTDLTLTVNSSEQFVFSAAILSPTLVTPVLGAATGTSLAASGAITSSSPSAKIGYATGAGGAVTQITSRATTVVMVPNPCTSGAITTTADSLAGLAIVTFTVTDSAVAATDVVVLSKTAGDVDTFAWVNTVGAGSFTVTLRNSHATDADTTAFVLNFAVIKAVAN